MICFLKMAAFSNAKKKTGQLNYTVKLLYPKNLKLKPFQEDLILAQLENENPYIYDASEMRLGKTIMAAVYWNTLGAKKCLYVVPANLRLNWIEELNKWHLPDVTFCVVSYSLLVARPELLKEIIAEKWDSVTYDEFHMCKNPDSLRTIAAFMLFDCGVLGVRMLSGTPYTKAATDLFPAIAAVVSRLPNVSKRTKDLCESLEKFGKQFSYGYTSHFGGTAKTIYKGTRKANEPQFIKILYEETKMMYVKTIEEVAPELPKMDHTICSLDLDVDLSMAPEKLAQFEAAFRKMNQDALKRRKGVKMPEPTGYSTVRRLLGVAKANCKDLYLYIESYLEAGLPCIIMCFHTEVAQTIKKHLKKWNPVLYTGKQNEREKDAAKNAFQNGKSDVFIGNIAAASLGLNLSRSCHTFMVEVTWLPHDVTQACKRMINLDKTTPCMAHFFQSNNEFDRKMIRNMVERQKQIERVI